MSKLLLNMTTSMSIMVSLVGIRMHIPRKRAEMDRIGHLRMELTIAF